MNNLLIFLLILFSFTGCKKTEVYPFSKYENHGDLVLKSFGKNKKTDKIKFKKLKVSSVNADFYWNGKYLNGTVKVNYSDFSGGETVFFTDKNVQIKKIKLKSGADKIKFKNDYKNGLKRVFFEIPGNKKGQLNIFVTVEPIVSSAKGSGRYLLFNAKPLFMSEYNEKLPLEINFKYLSSWTLNYEARKTAKIPETAEKPVKSSFLRKKIKNPDAYLEFLLLKNTVPVEFKPSKSIKINVFGIKDNEKTSKTVEILNSVYLILNKKNLKTPAESNIFINYKNSLISSYYGNYVFTQNVSSDFIYLAVSDNILSGIKNKTMKKALKALLAALLKKETSKSSLVAFLAKHKNMYINLLKNRSVLTAPAIKDPSLHRDTNILYHKRILVFAGLLSDKKDCLPTLSNFQKLLDSESALKELMNDKLLSGIDSIIKIRMQSLKIVNNGVSVKIKNTGDKSWCIPYTYMTDKNTYSGTVLLPEPGKIKEFFIQSQGKPKDINFDPSKITPLLPLDWHY